MSEILPCIGLNRHAEKRLREGHPWIFSNEVAETERLQRLDAGKMMDVLDCHGNYVGTGFVNPKSLIAIRFLSRRRGEAIDKGFFVAKMRNAIRLREKFYGANTDSKGSYRAIFGESDGLPGLVVDRFQGVWVIEPHARGMDVRKEILMEALREAALAECGEGSITGIVYRTDTRAAQLEGMQIGADVAWGELPKDGVWAVEENIRFPVDPLAGQKTGFFFDQRENRSAFVRWIRATSGAKVLDTYCHLGAWGLRALQAGAAHVTFVDQSEKALAGVKKSAELLGGLDRCSFVCGDAEVELKKMSPQSFHAIALDPPAFIQSKKNVAQGMKAYLTMNGVATKLLKPGGALSTSSCSYHCEEGRFEDVVGQAIRAQGREPRIIWRGGAAWDHPALAGVAETRYLKNLLLTV
jgi:23S rRNA (cytosine1962-C5)-methyltransferase